MVPAMNHPLTSRSEAEFQPGQKVDILVLMANRYADIIREGIRAKANNEWREKVDKSIAARTAMLTVLRMAVIAVAEGRDQGADLTLEDKRSGGHDEIEIGFNGRRVFVSYKDLGTITIRHGTLPSQDEMPPAPQDADAWADQIVVKALKYLTGVPQESGPSGGSTGKAG